MDYLRPSAAPTIHSRQFPVLLSGSWQRKGEAVNHEWSNHARTSHVSGDADDELRLESSCTVISRVESFEVAVAPYLPPPPPAASA